ncbi:MAG: translation elongation factor Ts [Candidatus Omnitrophica bacterium]|nr:translation elongation factor Ts [Candidatus Omnitrophota bacterium]MBU4488250.1 translation elongation factor Ts [Candidatus Omnitrophota bacterium]MCG2704698.1 translation elongation factor Ts [Candidatus Omnitrophota bacterium]
MVDAKTVQKLREKTGVGMMVCKEALREAGGDIEKAVEILRKKGAAKAVKHSGRSAKEGVVDSYIHLGGKIGVLLEMSCETDFAAKSKDFKELAKDICMHIAASNPLYIKREDVPNELIAKEKEIFKAQVQNKPAAAIDKIVEGKLEKFYEDTCLLEQPFVKNPDMTIKEYIVSHVAKIGENIVIRRFSRYQLGEEA